MIKEISTNNAPQAIGPYSQAVQIENFIYCSGQIPIDPKTSEVVANDIEIQTNQVMKNISAILDESKLDFSNVIKTTIFLKDMNQFSIVNDVYNSYFMQNKPARSTVEVSRLPKDVLIEIEVVAYNP
jgi:2-iminobutanoate/2-iminopropanoate deaminase